jgi:cell division septum initiation protein DivIVA
MSFPHVSFVLEVMGACLLLVMIIYAVQLNRRLSRLQADKAYLQKMIVSFNQATERAESSVNRLRAAAIEANDALQTNTNVAKELRGDLSFLIDRAEVMADRLERSVGNGRAAGAAASAPSAEISAFRPANRAANKTRETSAPTPAKAALSRALAGLR